MEVNLYFVKGLVDLQLNLKLLVDSLCMHFIMLIGGDFCTKQQARCCNMICQYR